MMPSDDSQDSVHSAASPDVISIIYGGEIVAVRNVSSGLTYMIVPIFASHWLDIIRTAKNLESDEIANIVISVGS